MIAVLYLLDKLITGVRVAHTKVDSASIENLRFLTGETYTYFFLPYVSSQY